MKHKSFITFYKFSVTVKELQDRLDEMWEQARICDNCEQL